MQETKFHGQGKLLFFRKDYISEFVYGGIDGAIITFAVVAEAEGANLSLAIVIILGMANLIADGFSMSIGNFFLPKQKETLLKNIRPLSTGKLKT